MSEVSKSAEIGLRRGRVIANLSQSEQLDLIAEGMPVLLASAEELFAASKEVAERPRVSRVLEGHALEEVAKILVLLDIVRCPPALRSSRIGPMMRWFYDHLARLIYVEAQSWKPTDAAELQEYINGDRQSHYLEGAVGEYIVPNAAIYRRESLLYADIETYEDGLPRWTAPHAYRSVSPFEPGPWRVCKALHDMGAMERDGLDIMSEAYSQVDFLGTQNSSASRRLTYEMLVKLQAAGLISDAATDDQVSLLYGDWQMPMYRMDFGRVEVPLEQLRDERETLLWSEAGY
jgi:hypothetical protein